MFFQRNIPKWVKEFSPENEREALTALAKASNGPFDKPREMNFVLYGFKKDHDLEEVIRRLQKEDWMCDVQEQADQPDRYVLTGTKKDYQLTYDNYYRDSIMYRRLAEQFNVGFDGWYASN